jgi:hypothetical protein
MIEKLNDQIGIITKNIIKIIWNMNNHIMTNISLNNQKSDSTHRMTLNKMILMKALQILEKI